MAVYCETIRSCSISATACRNCSMLSSGALLRRQRIQPPHPAPCSSSSSSSSSISQFHEDSYISSWTNCTTTRSAHAALYLAQSCNYRITIIRSSKHKLVSKSSQLLPCVAAAACKSHAWIPCIKSEIVGQSCSGFSTAASSSSSSASSSAGCKWRRFRACALLNFKFVAHNRPIITAGSKNYSLPIGHDGARDEEEEFDSDSDGDGERGRSKAQDCLQPISSDGELQAGSAASSSTPPPAALVASPNDVPSEEGAQLSRIARDVLYLIFACSLVGIVRVLESLVATFSSSPPRYAKLLDAAHSLDFFTMAFLAHSLRKPLISILHADPINLDLVLQLKAKIWDEMHNFYERQWKVLATLGVGRLLALLAQTLPSTTTLTKTIKMGWEMLLELPIF